MIFQSSKSSIIIFLLVQMQTVLKSILFLMFILVSSADFTLQSAPSSPTLSATNYIAGWDSITITSLVQQVYPPYPWFGWRAQKSIQLFWVCRVPSLGAPACPSIANLDCSNSNLQAADLDTSGWNEVYQVSVSLNASSMYRFSFYWGNFFNSNPNGMNVFINGTLILNITNYNTCAQNTTTQFYFTTNESGPTIFSFQGTGVLDATGIFLNNITLRRVTSYVAPAVTPPTNTSNSTSVTPSPILPNFTNPDYEFSFYNSSEFNSLVANKVSSVNYQFFDSLSFFTNIGVIYQQIVLKFSLGYFANFNRLLLYVYHNRTYSVNAKSYLLAVKSFDQYTNSFAYNYLFTKIGSNATILQINANSKYDFSFNFKPNMTGFYPQNFLNQILLFFMRDTLIVLIVFIFFKVLYTMLRKKLISIKLRSFIFYSSVFLMLFDGKIEKFTFYLLSQIRIFSSVNFNSKFQNASIIVFYICALIISISTYLLALKFLKKKIRYVITEYRAKFSMLLPILIICPLFDVFRGFIHGILIFHNYIQIFTLFIIEIGYCIFVLYPMLKSMTKSYLRIFWEVLFCIQRIILQLLFFVWNVFTDGKEEKLHLSIDSCQEYLFISYMITYFFAISSTVVFEIYQVALILLKKYSKRRGNLRKTSKKIQKKKEKKKKIDSLPFMKPQRFKKSKNRDVSQQGKGLKIKNSPFSPHKMRRN